MPADAKVTAPFTAATPAGGRRRVTSVPTSTTDVARAVNTLAWPVIMENLFQTALGTASMIMVADIGAAAVAGVGTATQIIFVVQAAFGAVTTGTTVLIARAVGAGRDEEANLITKQSLVLGTVLALVLGFIGYYFSDTLVALLGAEAEVVALGGSYLRITMLSGIVLLGMFVISGALRGAGDTRTPMMVTGFINVVNIGVAYVLIFGKLGFPALGVDGAAWAVAISRTIGMAVLLWLLLRGRSVLDIRGLQGWWPNLGIYRRIANLGTPSMLEQLAMSGGMLVYGIIAIRLGTTVYAVQRITFQALSFSMMPGMGFAMAATSMVGQCLGACRADLSELSSWYSVKMATAWMTFMGLVMVFFGNPVMRVFTDDPEMIELGVQALRVIAIGQPFLAVSMVLAGSLRGAGDTRFPMYSTTLAVWAIRIPFGYLFGLVLGWGLPGIYLSNVLDAFARGAAQFFRYRAGRWRDIVV